MIYWISSVILIVIILIWSFRTNEVNMMKGFWRADAQFCENAELSMFVLYLGDNTSLLGNCRYSYILASNPHGIILNHPVQLTFSGSYCVEPFMSKFRNYNVSAEWLDEDVEQDVFPSEFCAAYYPANGKLVLYSGDSVLATLWKDLQMSALGSDDLCPKDVLDDGDTNSADSESI